MFKIYHASEMSPFRFASAIVARAAFALSATADAATITLDLDDYASGKNWKTMPRSTQAVNQPYASIVSLEGTEWLQISRTSTATGQNANSAQVIYHGGHLNASGNPTQHADNQFGDVRGSMILAASGWGSVTDANGFIIRSSAPGFNTTSAYFLSVNSAGTDGSVQLTLNWNVGERFINHVDVQVLAAKQATGISLNPTTPTSLNPYFLEFSFEGNLFNATLSYWDEDHNIKGEEIVALSYIETRRDVPTQGFVGIRGGRYGAVRDGYFREVRFETIPEPSAALLLLPIGLAWRFLKRKRR